MKRETAPRKKAPRRAKTGGSSRKISSAAALRAVRRATKTAGTSTRVESRPAVLAWQPTPEAKKVIDTCQDVFDNTSGAKSDCNKFVKAACSKLSINPFAAGDDADAITKNIRDATWRTANGWSGLDQDPKKAKAAADAGDLVIGGATGSDLGQTHGHVVVVVSSEKLWKDYPYGSWGTLGGTGQTNAKLTLAYKLSDLPNVSYMSKKI